METDDIDGILWSVRDMEHLFPETLQTRSGRVYPIRDLFDKKEGQDILFLEWAPQVAILHHPSTQLFLTHGGIGSVYEALYNEWLWTLDEEERSGAGNQGGSRGLA
ncbi:hypothetical protein G6F31_017374 [Rhizopus arrhizus]|nr:hypothetical protein G6F31_017374 [Rhizopus arrhizus]